VHKTSLLMGHVGGPFVLSCGQYYRTCPTQGAS